MRRQSGKQSKKIPEEGYLLHIDGAVNKWWRSKRRLDQRNLFYVFLLTLTVHFFCAPLGNDKIVLFDKNAVFDERDVVLPRKETGRYSEGELE